MVCHHVLHLLPPEQQQQELDRLLGQLAAGGCLLLSSYSEPSEHDNAELLEIVKARLRMLGMDEATLELFLSGRNKVVFSLAEALLQQQAQQWGCDPPQVLMRAMFNGLWLLQRQQT